MYSYDGQNVEIDKVYNYKGDVYDIASEDASVGYVTKPEYKTVNGNSYRLVWHDEFSEDDLRKDFWNDVMFVNFVENRYQAWSDYYLSDDKLHLRIKEDAPDRFLDDPTNNVAESIVMTGENNYLHKTTPFYHDINPFWGLLVQEGYWECKFKVFPATGGCHTAWWTVGIQDGLNEESPRAEIDVTEILAHQSTNIPHGVHRWNDTAATEFYKTTSAGVNFATGFHTVGFLWENGVMKWYVDGNLVDSNTNITTPQYPMIMILSAYKRISGTGWTGDADTSLGDVEFEIDYLRIYKKATTESTEAVTIDSYTPMTINGNTADMSIDENRGCPVCFPSYVYVNWSDGSRTEHWVKWDAVKDTYRTKMTNNQSFTWAGYTYGIGLDVVANVNY